MATLATVLYGYPSNSMATLATAWLAQLEQCFYQCTEYLRDAS